MNYLCYFAREHNIDIKENKTTNNNKKFVAVVFMDDKELGTGSATPKKKRAKLQKFSYFALTIFKNLVLYDLKTPFPRCRSFFNPSKFYSI